MGMEVNGLDEALSMLENMCTPDAADEIMLTALKTEAKKIQAAARLLCPVDTGQLRRSIVVENTPNGVSVGTNNEYAIYVEYGTGKFGDKSVTHTEKEYWRYQGVDGEWYTVHGQPPRPFMAPAYEAYKNEISDNVKNYVLRRLENDD